MPTATLQVGAGGASGSLGSGNIVNNGNLDFNRTGTLTVSGAISGTGSVTNDGTGTVILADNNTYSGGTTINAGTLQIGNGGATGSLNGNGPIVNNGTLIFNTTGAFTYRIWRHHQRNGKCDRTRRRPAEGCIGKPTLIPAGRRLTPAPRSSLAKATTASLLSSVDHQQRHAQTGPPGHRRVRHYANNIVGTGRVVKDVNNVNPGDVTLTGTNTYTGGTFIGGGGTCPRRWHHPQRRLDRRQRRLHQQHRTRRQPVRTLLTFNRPDDFTFSGNIIGAVTDSAVGATRAS